MSISDNELYFRLQIIQDVSSAYYSFPIRLMKRDASDIAFRLLDNSNFFKKHNITDIKTFQYFINNFMNDMPNLYRDTISRGKQHYIQNTLKEFAEEDIRKISKEIFITYASFHPKLYRKLKSNPLFFALVIFSALYISLNHDTHKEQKIEKNFAFTSIKYDDMIVIVGPTCKEKSFSFFVKNLIKLFDLEFHTFELEMLHEDKETSIDTRTVQIKELFDNHIFELASLDTRASLSQSDIKKIAMFGINKQGKNTGSYIKLDNNNYLVYDTKYYITNLCPKNLNKENLLRTTKAVKKHYNFFQLEAFNSIGENLYSKFIPLERNPHDEGGFKNAILKALRRLVYADAILLYNYKEYNQEFELLESDGLSESEQNKVKNALQLINKDKSKTKERKSAITQKIIDGYHNEGNVGLLKNNVTKEDMNQPFEDKKIKSILSIPLIFDHKIRGILHFFSYRKYAFDEQNERFLFQFSDYLTYLMIESIFLGKQTSIIKSMNKEEFSQQEQSNELTEIVTDIADIFSSDGAMIFLDSSKISDSATERGSIHLKAHIGMDTPSKMSLSAENDDSFLGKNGSGIIVVKDIMKVKNEMKYYDVFHQNNIKSFMAIKIIGSRGRLEGAIVIIDKKHRTYNTLSKRMLSIVSEEISLLNTLNAHILKGQRDRELVLHEIRQTFIGLKKQVSRLDWRLKSNTVQYLDAYDKKNIFRNMEDLKLYAETSISFVNNFFQGDKNKPIDYDATIKRDVETINHHLDNGESFISIRSACTRIFTSNDVLIYNNKIDIPTSIKLKIPSDILDKIMRNIIGNAIKYQNRGSSISISHEIVGRHVHIHVDNTGPKILEDERETIFARGRRGTYVEKAVKEGERSEWKKSKDENRGLGCYYMRELLRGSKIKGTIKFKEMESIGSKYARNRFTISFPMRYIKGIKNDNTMDR